MYLKQKTLLTELEDVISLVDSHQVNIKTKEHFLPAAYLFYQYLTVVELSADPVPLIYDDDFLPENQRKVVQAMQKLDFVLLQLEIQQND